MGRDRRSSSFERAPAPSGGASGSFRSAEERGAVLIHVALGLVALTAFSALVLDYGVMWTARSQAQNAADAGARAGASALAYDNATDLSATGPAVQEAIRLATMNLVWGAAPGVTTSDVTFPPCPDGSANPCIRVDVHRDTLRGNALPTYFGQLVGVTQQNVRATAIAEVMKGNASDCVRPWSIPDKWTEKQCPPDKCPWQQDDAFDLFDSKGLPLANPDVYVAPSSSGPGTGFTVANDYGTKLILKYNDPNKVPLAQAGWFFPVDLPRADGQPDTGGARYAANIANCNTVPISIGDTLTTEPGNKVGPTRQGVQNLIDQDPNATWNTSTKSVQGSCAQSASPCAALSPRIVAIALFNPDTYETNRHNGRFDIVVSNMLGFFIAGLQGNDVVGYLVDYPGLRTNATTTTSGLLPVIVLVR